MSPHAIPYRPKPVHYRLHRPWWRRYGGPVLRVLFVLGLAGGLVLGVTWVIARMHATEAQLEAAHAQGMAVGATLCRSE